jgi:hypothetical protein
VFKRIGVAVFVLAMKIGGGRINNNQSSIFTLASQLGHRLFGACA